MNAEQPESNGSENAGAFQVCPSCHRWYRDSSRPWWDDHCSECSEAQQERTRARIEALDAATAPEPPEVMRPEPSAPVARAPGTQLPEPA